jgi:hypothetical protein
VDTTAPGVAEAAWPVVAEPAWPAVVDCVVWAAFDELEPFDPLSSLSSFGP